MAPAMIALLAACERALLSDDYDDLLSDAWDFRAAGARLSRLSTLAVEKAVGMQSRPMPQKARRVSA